MQLDALMSRRRLVGFGAAIVTVLATGCSGGDQDGGSGAAKANLSQAKADLIPITVYRDPNCGCCEKWAVQARDAGFEPSVVDEPDMASVKRRLGVPEELASCHTALIGGYAVEGHVPFADVSRLLADRPVGVKGLAVPGMPMGSPGMEAPDGSKQPFQVIAFAPGKTFVFSNSA